MTNIIAIRFRGVTMWIAVLLMSTVVTFAIPEYSLLTGNRCINCHVKAQGGGLRNDLGFYANEGVSLFQPSKQSTLGGLFSNMQNTALDGILTFGSDIRLMSARSAVSPITAEPPKRKLFPMQVSFMAALQAASWLIVEAQYNAGRSVYPGQQPGSASLIVQPSLDLPSLRVGYFQPSVGISYDDHTMLVRQEPDATPSPIIPPYYAEAGAEIRYNAPLWLDVSAGVFSSKNLSDVYTKDSAGLARSLMSGAGSPLLNGRVCLTPRFFEDQVNSYAGASIVHSDDFTMINSFAGVAWQDKVGILMESVMQGNRDARQVRSVSSELFGRVADPLYVFVRMEHGTSTNVIKGERQSSYCTQYVLGSKILLFPCVEFRPEYRIIETDEFLRTRWMFQLHFYY